MRFHFRIRSAKNDFPITITFDADDADVTVDGRDFCIRYFRAVIPPRRGSWHGGSSRRHPPISHLENGNQCQRLALRDVAVQDKDVVQAHAASGL